MTPKYTIDGLISRVGELPPLPHVAQRALALIRNPDSSMADLSRLLAMDEAMTSLILRWANSAYYGIRYPVSTVQHAVVYLGQRTLHSLILAASVSAVLNRPAPGYALERGELWKHALGIAAGARLIAARYGNQIAEEAYHAGLLCDIGKLAFEMLLRHTNTNSSDWQADSFVEQEAAHFGVDHAALGAEMARRWQLPSKMTDAIANHHTPSRAQEGATLADAIHLADACMMMLGVGIGRDGLQYKLDPGACQRMGWSDTRFQEIADKVLPFLEEANQMLN